MMLCPTQILRFSLGRNKKLIWTWIKINKKNTHIFSSLAKIRSHYVAVAHTCISCNMYYNPIRREGNSIKFYVSAGQELSAVAPFVSLAPTCTYLSAITHFLHCLSPPKSSRANKKSTKSHITVSVFCKSCAKRHYTHLVTPLPHAARTATALRLGAPHHKKYEPGFCTKWDEKAMLGPCPVFTQRIMWPWRVVLQ